MAVPIEELGEKLKKYLKEGRRVTFLGTGVPVHKAKITEEILPGEAGYICAGKYEPAESCIRRNTGNAVL